MCHSAAVLSKLRLGRPSVDPVVWRPPPARNAPVASRDSGYRLEVFPVPGIGPEDVVLDAEGRIITGLSDGRILRLSNDGKGIETLANTGGRPLGIELFANGDLLACDARRGLLRIAPQRGAVQLLCGEIFGQPLRFCNNAAIARDGTIYFSDSSRRFGIDHWKAELIEHSGTGRLLRLAPNGELDLLLDGLEFANGVALAADESFVSVAETGAYRVQRYWLGGPRAGSADILIDQLAGFPDNISTGSDGLIWISQASPRDPLLDALHARHPLWRKLTWALPDALQPRPKRIVWLLGVDSAGRVMHEIAYPGDRYHMVTGVRELAGDVYLGSLVEGAVAVLRRG
jgi:sugar lactone lactonase YvrE